MCLGVELHIHLVPPLDIGARETTGALRCASPYVLEVDDIFVGAPRNPCQRRSDCVCVWRSGASCSLPVHYLFNSR